nr:MAG TPA: Fibronectin type 3 domain [Caudoviricetes sp.]
MAKIYGTPIMAGGAGGANKDLPPLLDNFKAFKGGGTSENPHITIQADKMATSRANELAGAVWVYGDHEPTSVNDGTKIQLAREEVVTSDGGEAQTVTKTVEWNNEANFFARQFTYNSKKQYQTMLEGAIATLVLTGVPDPVTELAETHSGSSITLTWKNPTSDEFYDHTVVVYKTGAFPTAIDDGTQGYSGTDETATLSGLELGSTYYIAVFTVSAYGLYGEPQTVQVEIPVGQLLSSLASGTKVKLGKWNNTDLQWKVARDTSDQSIRLVLEPTSVSLLGNKQYDAAEPRNSNFDRKNYGNNRYIYSNIHQWLNATKATGWYVAQHSVDAEPAYSSSPGFLSGWSENHIAALDGATLTTSKARVDGGGTETFVARVALISTAELGLRSNTGGGRLDIFNSDEDRATGSCYWTRTPIPSYPDGVYPVTDAGDLSDYEAAYTTLGVRPLCIPASTALVSPEKDDDNCYIVQ